MEIKNKQELVEKFVEELYKKNPEISKEYISRIKDDLNKNSDLIDLNSLYQTNDLDNLRIIELLDKTDETEMEAKELNNKLVDKAKDKMLEERKISKQDIGKVVYEEKFVVEKPTLADLINSYYDKEIKQNPDNINEQIKEQENTALEYIKEKTKFK